MTDHLTEHHPISDAQWGFQKAKSTLTAHDWLKNWMRMLCIFTSRRPLMIFPTEELWKNWNSFIYISDCNQAVQLPYKASTKCCNQWSIFTFHPCDFCCTPGLGFRAVTPIMTAFLHLIFLKVVKFLSMQMTCFSLKTSLQAGFCQTAGKHRSDLWLVYFKTNEDKLQLQAVHPCKKFAECTNYPAIHNLLVSN